MKRLLSIFVAIVGFAFVSMLNLQDAGCPVEDAIGQDMDICITQQESLHMPVEKPVSYSGTPSVVVSSIYCRVIGKHKSNVLVPQICEQVTAALSANLFKFGEVSSPHSNVSYAIDYYIYELRRIII